MTGPGAHPPVPAGFPPPGQPAVPAGYYGPPGGSAARYGPLPYPGQRPAPTGPQPKLVWEATPPREVSAPPVARRRRRYLGPPAYPAVPRWGFPRLSWRPSASVPGTVTRVLPTAATVRGYAQLAWPVLWALVGFAGLAAAGEVFRYVLLVLGRDRALPGALVAWSDALVNIGAGVSLCMGVLAAVLLVRWLFAVRHVTAELAGVRPERPTWTVALGVLLPVLNIVLAGAVLAEIEHTTRQPTARVRPSRLVLSWWLVWAAGEVVALATLLLRLRGGVQAMADGVLWHAVTDALACALAVLTLRVVDRFTRQASPVAEPAEPLGTVVRVLDAPAPVRAPRPVSAPR